MILLSRWGTLPFLAARGEAEISLQTTGGPPWKLHAIATDGSRIGEVPFQTLSSGGIRFQAKVFQKKGGTLAYELVRSSGSTAD